MIWRAICLFVLLVEGLIAQGLRPRRVEVIGNATVGFYCVHLYVGSRMQKQCLIIDTGSSITTFPCKGCSFYGDKHYDPIYDFDRSEFFDATASRAQELGWTCKNRNDKGNCPFSIVVSVH